MAASNFTNKEKTILRLMVQQKLNADDAEDTFYQAAMAEDSVVKAQIETFRLERIAELQQAKTQHTNSANELQNEINDLNA